MFGKVFKPSPPVCLILVIFTCFGISPVHGQIHEINYNEYYKYLFSLGIEYQTLTLFNDYSSQFNVYDISASFRMPIQSLHILQPTLQGGIIRFDHTNSDEKDRLEHTHIYGAGGLTVSSRISKTFELGGDCLLGLSQTYFYNLFPDEEPVVYGGKNFFSQLGLRICFNPAYNFTIEFHPNFKYLVSLDGISGLYGFIFGFGISGSYRFGDDPDAAGPVIKDLSIENISFPPMFAGMQYYYGKHPFTSITLTNTRKHDIENIEVYFYQKGYMDSPTPAGSIRKLPGKSSVDVPLYSLFNETVFTLEGLTPLIGEIIITYKSGGRYVKQQEPVSYDLYDKTALVWGDDRKAAAYITGADSALRNYTSYVMKLFHKSLIQDYNFPLQFAVLLYYSLKKLEITYQPDPVHPFASVKNSSFVIDSISLPRETLQRTTGDCDDLTVLFCSLLETVGIETGFITISDHIFPAFCLKLRENQFRNILPDLSMFIIDNHQLWVPLEITLLGKIDFLTAWKTAIERYKNEIDSERKFIRTKTAQNIYKPIGLKEVDIGLQYGSKEETRIDVETEVNNLLDNLIRYIDEFAKTKEDFNEFGILCTKLKRYATAEYAFLKSVSLGNSYIYPLMNLGNLFFLKEDYNSALEKYKKAVNFYLYSGDTRSKEYSCLLYNISVTYFRLGDKEKAGEFYEKALAINPHIVNNKYNYIYKNQPEDDKCKSTESQFENISTFYFSERFESDE